MAENPKSNPSGIHVLIIGAGLTGLVIAQGLKKADISHSIFEKESSNSPRARSWTLGLHWGAPYLKSLLPESLHARLREAYCDPFYPYDQPVEFIQHYNGKTGSMLRSIPVPGLKRVDRQRLRSLCSEGLDIQYDKTLISLEYDAGGEEVTAFFEDGSHVRANLVVGAEGAQSTVREEILGKEKAEPIVSSDLANMMTIINYEDAEKARHLRSVSSTFGTAYHPDGLF